MTISVSRAKPCSTAKPHSMLTVSAHTGCHSEIRRAAAVFPCGPTSYGTWTAAEGGATRPPSLKNSQLARDSEALSRQGRPKRPYVTWDRLDKERPRSVGI